MKMIPSEFKQFNEISEKAFQAVLVCSLIKDYPYQLTEPEVSTLASLIKKLSGDVYVYMNDMIYKQEYENNELAPDTSTIGKRINAMRVKMHMSPSELEEEMKLPEGSLFRWETGKVVPGSTHIDKLANILHCDPLWLKTGNKKEVAK